MHRLAFKTVYLFGDLSLILKLVICEMCCRRGESGASLAAKRFEQQRRQELLQQVPLRQFDDCSCYTAKAMTMTTTIPVYDCPCGVAADTTTADNAGRIPPPPPALLFPFGGGAGTPTCDVCGRPLSAAFGGDESLCRCARVWESAYSRVPVSDTGNHMTTATASCRRVASLRSSDVTDATTPLNDVRHVTATSAVGDIGRTLTSRRCDDANSRRVASD